MEILPVKISARGVVVKNDRILLVEFDDESGLHYNLPGGRVEQGESLLETVVREVQEETCAQVSVAHFLAACEYVPEKYNFRYGSRQVIDFIFLCRLDETSEARLPDNPDANQTAVRWFSFADFLKAPLIPPVQPQILALLGEPAGPERFTTLTEQN